MNAHDPRHGTSAGYQAGCRLRCCKNGVAAYARSLKRNRPPLAPDDPRHGKPSTYVNWECHCERCTDAHRDYHRAYMNADPERLELHALRQRLRVAAKRKAG